MVHPLFRLKAENRVGKITALSCLALGLMVSSVSQAQDDTISTNSKRVSAQLLYTPVLADAPKADFERVAWCHGALSGHMDIATRIKSNDEVMKTIGQAYLKAYEAALTLSEDGKTDEGKARAEAARQSGFNGWEAVRLASPSRQGGAYLNWVLPGECERAAITISGHPNLFEEMADAHESKVISDTLKPFATGKPVKLSDLDPSVGGDKTLKPKVKAVESPAPAPVLIPPATVKITETVATPEATTQDTTSPDTATIAVPAAEPEARDAKTVLKQAAKKPKTKKHKTAPKASGLRGKA